MVKCFSSSSSSLKGKTCRMHILPQEERNCVLHDGCEKYFCIMYKNVFLFFKKKSQFIEPSCWNKTFFCSFSKFVKLTTVHLPFKQTHYEGMKSVSLNNVCMFCLSSFLPSFCLYLSLYLFLSDIPFCSS